MLAVELDPEARDARRYCEALRSRGVLAKDTHDHTIRIAPPLVIAGDQVDWALEEIEATLKQDFCKGRIFTRRVPAGWGLTQSMLRISRKRACEGAGSSHDQTFPPVCEALHSRAHFKTARVERVRTIPSARLSLTQRPARRTPSENSRRPAIAISVTFSPSIGAVKPALTIIANVLRVGDNIAARLLA